MGILTNISLFSGAGGLDLGAKIIGGFRTIAYCEWDPYAQAVLISRMQDGGLDDAPLWDDVSTFDGRPFRGRVDVISGGFPCQDLSYAGKREGITGSRSGLWKQYARIVDEVRPRFIIVENVAGLLADGALGVVLGDVASMGFNAEWAMFPAAAVGAPHIRERVILIAYAHGTHGTIPHGIVGNGREQIEERATKVWGKDRLGPLLGPGRKLSPERLQEISGLGEPPLLRVDDGMADWVELRIRGALKVCGNGVVPQQVAPAWEKVRRIASNMAVK